MEWSIELSFWWVTVVLSSKVDSVSGLVAHAHLAYWGMQECEYYCWMSDDFKQWFLAKLCLLFLLLLGLILLGQVSGSF